MQNKNEFLSGTSNGLASFMIDKWHGFSCNGSQTNVHMKNLFVKLPKEIIRRIFQNTITFFTP